MEKHKRRLIYRIYCGLCQKEKPLCKSHIIPEFCYRLLYDGNLPALELDRRKTKGEPKKIQTGENEPLLCADCEQYINKKYEQPFQSDWVNSSILPDPMKEDRITIRLPDYSRFKLFHLSILWRASLARREFWDNVNLSYRQEDRLRSMLLSGDAGALSVYPICCMAAVDPENRIQRDIIVQPTEYRIYSMYALGFTFAGASWHYCCSKRYDERATSVCLKENGELPIIRTDIFKNPDVALIAGTTLKRLGKF